MGRGDTSYNPQSQPGKKYRKRGDEARLRAWAVNMLGLPGAGSFGPTLWSTLMTTRRVAGIAGLRF